MSDNDSDNDSEYGDSSGTGTLFKPSFVLIAIDTHPSMFVKKENDINTPFKTCLNVCYDMANSLIFTQNKRSWSPFGIVLALEDASAEFVNFSDNVLTSIKFLKEKQNLSEDDLRKSYQRKGTFDMSSFFLFCKKKFKEVNSVFYKRTIIYVTNDDNPTQDDKNQRFAVLNEAKNFEPNGINFEMITMNSDFNYKTFYNEMFSVMKVPLIETIIEDEEGLMEKLSSLIIKKIYQRKLLFFPLINDQTKFLKVVQKAFIREERMYSNAYISSDGEALNKVLSNDSGVDRYSIPDCPCPLEFDIEEHAETLNNNLHVGYTLLYVSDRVTEVGSILIDNLILDSDPKEELPHFNTFWRYCVKNKKVLVCARKLRELDKLRFVEFIPKFVNNRRVFLIKAIPFNDENYYPPSALRTDAENVEYSKEKLKRTNELINNLTFDYDPKMFVDPVVAKKKAFLRAKLLDEPKEEVEDVTLDNDGIDKSLGKIGEDFKFLFNLEEEAGTKRRAPAAGGRSKRKK